MSDLIWLSDAQMRRIERHFPRSHGVPRVDDRRIVIEFSPAHCAMLGRRPGFCSLAPCLSASKARPVT
jgi:hypothetical protein